MINSTRCSLTVAVAMTPLTGYGQVYFPETGHTYESVLVPDGITWDDASAAAQAAGGYLATITSASEDQFVFDLINNPVFYSPPSVSGDFLGPWLGGRKATGQSNFEWVTSEPFAYSNFENNQPDGVFGSDQKIQYYKVNSLAAGSKWGDHPGGPIPGYFLPTAYVIERVPEAGDFNHDGTVDAADYVVWRKTGGSSDDYNIWRANFGRTYFAAGSAGVNTNVPEPTTLVLVMLAAACRCLRRRRPQ
jgi:hypothetical protein